MERRSIAIRGIVQGVGFRPFVYGLASRLHLRGFVKNQTDGVLIEVEGKAESLENFLEELFGRPPPLAQIDQIRWVALAPQNDEAFRIEQSDVDPKGLIFISPDVATCADCLAELNNPRDRRFCYPFINCTNCGPRLTIVTGAPYDRHRTTMGSFPLCEACRAEYQNPKDRRFHAQPNACRICGPNISLLNAQGQAEETGDPLGLFCRALLAGRIGAIKGVGGYHLTCDARNAFAVRELRHRKQRDEKPFAVMVQDLEKAEALCFIETGERNLLKSPAHPIVLLLKRNTGNAAKEVAPGNPYLGIMLPNTPLHHLLLRSLDGIPLVMTSGNRSDEPIAYEEEVALKSLKGIADFFLIHNRPIHVRCDDSVTRLIDGVELPLRRSRGYAPQPITLPLECPCPILAVGGQFKVTFALGRNRHAFLSQHMGDLDHYPAFQAYERDICLFRQLFAIEPELIAHDLHPDYASTRYALSQGHDGVTEPKRRREQKWQKGNLGEAFTDNRPRLFGVQHHHAHIASCMAENGLQEPVIGVAFDGTGFGIDGAVWGGEFLVGEYHQFHRVGHLRYVGMPGGDRAVREPWRMAVAHLVDAQVDRRMLRNRVGPEALRTLEKMLERNFNTPQTSSAGRLFDAVAAVAGVRDKTQYEGQAAMEMEWLATGLKIDGVYPFDIEEPQRNKTDPGSLIVDTRPLIRAAAADVLRGVDPHRIGRRFHSTMVEIIASVCGRIAKIWRLEAVVLSGGVFMNALLTREVVERLKGNGFRVYRHCQVPPNDGGLSLGQLAVAAAKMIGSGKENPSSSFN